jgi:hypothetical protein
MRFCENLHGGLNKLAEMLEVCSHKVYRHARSVWVWGLGWGVLRDGVEGVWGLGCGGG